MLPLKSALHYYKESIWHIQVDYKEDNGAVVVAQW